MEATDGVKNVHHVHIWQLDEHHNALEAHVVSEAEQLGVIEAVKSEIKAMLSDKFNVGHSTLEFEHQAKSDCKETNDN